MHKKPFSLVYARFAASRIVKSSLGMLLLFMLNSYAQSAGLVAAYPNEVERLKLFASMKGNTALTILYGPSSLLDGSTGGYLVWRGLSTMIIFGAIWAIVVTAKMLRGEEEASRQDFVLAKAVTPKKVLTISLAVLFASVLIQTIGTFLAVYASGKDPQIAITGKGALLFAFTLGSGSLLFMAITALTAQLYQLRKKAAVVASMVLIGLFVLRAVINLDDTYASLRYVSPLSWLDRVHPFSDQRVICFLPFYCLIALCIVATYFLHAKRDVGGAIITQNEVVKKPTRLVGSVFLHSWHSIKNSVYVWGVSILLGGGFISSLSKLPADTLNDSRAFKQGLASVTQATTTDVVKIFLGLVFFIVIILVSFAAASFISSLRSEESAGYLDAILVRPVSRLQWLGSRLIQIVISLTVIALGVGVVSWFLLPAGADISFTIMLEAGLNALFPALFIVGLGVATFGLFPRITGLIVYGLIAWSFLVEIIVSILAPDSFLLNTSLFHHVQAVPAAAINWGNGFIFILISSFLLVIGAFGFTRRDIEGE